MSPAEGQGSSETDRSTGLPVRVRREREPEGGWRSGGQAFRNRWRLGTPAFAEVDSECGGRYGWPWPDADERGWGGS
jgi:hypothetical protein